MKNSKYLFTIMLMCCCFLSAQSSDCNCCSEEHKAFDFWVGEWEVTNVATGTPAGKNTISKIQGECVLKENWISANPKFTGTSLNFYNLQTKQWEQLWIDNSGAHLKLKGNRIGDKMILSSDEFKGVDGKLYSNRVTWTINDNGTVRQLWEVLQGEAVKSVSFDGLYKRVK